MNRKEQIKMLRLERENADLRARLDKQFDIYRNQLYELVDMQTKLALIDLVLHGEEHERTNQS
jgi:hypothetical protein